MDRSGAAQVEAMIDTAFEGRQALLVRETSEAPGPDAARESALESRVLLVDGFNVLHAVLLGRDRDAGWWRREARERLLRRAQGWPGVSDEIWIAFDGSQPAWSVWAEPVAVPLDLPHPSGPRRPMVHSVFVESADDWIVRRARRTPDPERTIVVSADRKVAGRARSAGCEIWTPWSFMSRCPSTDELDPAKPGLR